MATASTRRAIRQDRRDARKYRRAAFRAVDALQTLADLEDGWLDFDAARQIDAMRGIVLDIELDVRREIGGDR